MNNNNNNNNNNLTCKAPVCAKKVQRHKFKSGVTNNLLALLAEKKIETVVRRIVALTVPCVFQAMICIRPVC